MIGFKTRAVIKAIKSGIDIGRMKKIMIRRMMRTAISLR